MTVKRVFNNIFFNVFILFLNTSVIDAFFKALYIPARLVSAIRLLTNACFILMLVYYFLTERIKNKKYYLSIFFIVFTGITIFWTVKRPEAIKLYINFAGSCCYFVMFICMAYKENILKTMKNYSTLIIILNILAITVLKEVVYIGTKPSGIVITGIHLSRSALIIYMDFCIFSYVYYLKTVKLSYIEKTFLIFMACVAAAIVVISKSSTGIVTMCLFFALLLITKYKGRSKLLMELAMFIGVALPFMKLSSSILNSIIYRLFKKTLTFTGRVYIWKYALDKLTSRPLLGNGFNSTSYLLANKIIPVYDRVAAHAHNGFLEVLLQLGAVGIITLCLILIYTFKNTFKISRKEGIILRAYMVVFVIFNFMEPYMVGNVPLVTVWFPIILILTMASGKIKTIGS